MVFCFSKPFAISASICGQLRIRVPFVAPEHALLTSPAEAAGGAGRHSAASRCRQPAPRPVLRRPGEERSLREGGLSPRTAAEPASSGAQRPVLPVLLGRRAALVSLPLPFLGRAVLRPAPYTHLEPRIHKTGVGERRRRGIPVEPNAQPASSSVQERHLPRLADKEIHTNRICRPDGALDYVGGQFYIDAAPTALEERVLC